MLRTNENLFRVNPYRTQQQQQHFALVNTGCNDEDEYIMNDDSDSSSCGDVTENDSIDWSPNNNQNSLRGSLLFRQTMKHNNNNNNNNNTMQTMPDFAPRVQSAHNRDRPTTLDQRRTLQAQLNFRPSFSSIRKKSVGVLQVKHTRTIELLSWNPDSQRPALSDSNATKSFQLTNAGGVSASSSYQQLKVRTAASLTRREQLQLEGAARLGPSGKRLAAGVLQQLDRAAALPPVRPTMKLMTLQKSTATSTTTMLEVLQLAGPTEDQVSLPSSSGNAHQLPEFARINGAPQSKSKRNDNNNNNNNTDKRSLRERIRFPVGRPECHLFQNSYFEFYGTAAEGIPQGPGTLFLRDGTKFCGTFVKGELTCSDGTRSWPDGSVYSGAFVEGEAHGQGVFMAASGGFRYEGAWEQGRFCGLGELIDRSNNIAYRGNFADGKFSGPGSMELFSVTPGAKEAPPRRRDYSLSGDGGGNNNSGSLKHSLPEVLFRISGNFQQGKLHGTGQIQHANGDTVNAEFVHGITSSAASEFTVSSSSILYRGEMIEQKQQHSSERRRVDYPDSPLIRRWVPHQLGLASISIDGSTNVSWSHPGRLALVRQRLDEQAASEKEHQKQIDLQLVADRQREKLQQQQSGGGGGGASPKQQQQQQHLQVPAAASSPAALRSPSSSPALSVLSGGGFGGAASAVQLSARSTGSDPGGAEGSLAEVSHMDLLNFCWFGPSDDFSVPPKRPADLLEWIMKNVPSSRKAKPPAEAAAAAAAALKKAKEEGKATPADMSGSTKSAKSQRGNHPMMTTTMKMKQLTAADLAVPLEIKAARISPLARVSLSLNLLCPDTVQVEARRQLLEMQQQQLSARRRHFGTASSSSLVGSTARTQVPVPDISITLSESSNNDSNSNGDLPNRIVVETGRRFHLRVYAIPSVDSDEWQILLQQCSNEILALLIEHSSNAKKENIDFGSAANASDNNNKLEEELRRKEKMLGTIIDVLTNRFDVSSVGAPMDLLDLGGNGPSGKFDAKQDAASVMGSLSAFKEQQQEVGTRKVSRVSSARRNSGFGTAAASSVSMSMSNRRPDSASKRVKFAMTGDGNAPSPSASASAIEREHTWNSSRFAVRNCITRSIVDGVLHFDFIVLSCDPKQQFLVDIQPDEESGHHFVQCVAGDELSLVAAPMTRRIRLRHIVPRKGQVLVEE